MRQLLPLTKEPSMGRTASTTHRRLFFAVGYCAELRFCKKNCIFVKTELYAPLRPIFREGGVGTSLKIGIFCFIM